MRSPARARAFMACWERRVIERVCIVGAGVIGSLYAVHLARVAEVSVLCRREEHARALNEAGLRVSGRHDLTSSVRASTDPAGSRAGARNRGHQDERAGAAAAERSGAAGPGRR